MAAVKKKKKKVGKKTQSATKAARNGNRKKTEAQIAIRAESSKFSTHAQKRREESYQALREKLKGAEYIRQLDDINAEFVEISKELEAGKIRRGKLKPSEKLDISMLDMQLDILRTRIVALKQRADLNFKRLSYVLPKPNNLLDNDNLDPMKLLAATFQEAMINA